MSTQTKQPVGRPVTKPRPPKPEFLTVVAGPTDSIGDVSRRAVKLADAKHCPVHFTFQGIEIVVVEGEDPMDGVNRWIKSFKEVRVKS